MSPGLRVDLHVHSRHSVDSRLTLPEIASAAERSKLDGFALTDHNTVSGHGELRAIAEEHPGWVLVPGVEVSTSEGHLLLYGVDEAPPPGRPCRDTVEWAVSRGGVAVPAHPFRWTHGVGLRRARELAVPALEAVNGHNRRAANERARALAAARSIGTTGGSDAHAAVEVGTAFTRFPETVRSLPELLAALRGGRTAGEGRSLSAFASVRSSIRSAGLRVTRRLRPV
jgi:predicted metal-dependent phosphoesterase TrpH